MINKYQAQAITNSKLNQTILNTFSTINNITMRIFTLNIVRDSNEAV